MDREHRRPDAGGEVRAAFDTRLCLVVEAVYAHERAARPGHRRLGRDGRVAPPGESVPDGGREGGVVRLVLRLQAEPDVSPGASLPAVGLLVRLGRWLEELD